MKHEIEAIYENGLLRPLEPLDFRDNERVRLTVQSSGDYLDDDAFQWATRESDTSVSLEHVRDILAKVDGNLADVVIAERGEY